MSSRPTAPERMRRVLAVVPWIVANPGRTVTEVADRFGITTKALLDDLNVVFMVGLPPYSPDALIDVQIDDEGRVTIGLADYFARPLRLSPAEGLALLAASDALLSIPGTDPGGALARALDKVRASMGMEGAARVDVHLGDAAEAHLVELRAAAEAGTEVEIDYYSFGRDSRSARTIAPWKVFSEAGAWYVHAWCNQAGGERVFRVDRIDDLQPVGTVSSRPRPDPGGPARAFNPDAGDPTVRLRLAPSARWVADAYPVSIIDDVADGPLTVEVVVTAVPWLERLLLRLGPDVEVVDGGDLPGAGDLGPRAAARVLARYR